MRCIYKLTIILFFTHLATYLPAQDCRDIIRRATELYEKGHLNEVREVLSEECIKILPTNKDKEEAYYLLAVASLYMKDLDSAQTSMMNILRRNPEYICKRRSPLGFQKYYETYRTSPVFVIGGKAGINASQIKSIKTYSLDEANTSKEGTYKNVLGYQVHGMIMLPITKRIGIMGELGYKYFAYQFQNTQFGYSKISFNEKQNWIELPILIRYNLGNNYVFKEDKRLLEKINPYVMLGVSGTFLLSSNALVSRQDDATGDRPFDSNTQVSVSNMRYKFGYYALGGLGFEYKPGRGVWSLEGRYIYGFSDVVKTKMRYDNQDLLFAYGYVDNDIRFRNLSISIGYAYPIYKPKQNKKFYIEDIPSLNKE